MSTRGLNIESGSLWSLNFINILSIWDIFKNIIGEALGFSICFNCETQRALIAPSNSVLDIVESQVVGGVLA